MKKILTLFVIVCTIAAQDQVVKRMVTASGALVTGDTIVVTMAIVDSAGVAKGDTTYRIPVDMETAGPTFELRAYAQMNIYNEVMPPEKAILAIPPVDDTLGVE